MRTDFLQEGRNRRDRRWQCPETYQLLAAIERCPTQQAICRCVLGYAGAFGAEFLLAGSIPPQSSTRLQQRSHVLLDAWPEDWSLRYFANGYLFRDPAIRLVTRHNEAFSWSELPGLCALCTAERRVMNEAAAFGLRQGVTFAFCTLEQQAIGFSLAGERFELSPAERVSLHLVAAFALSCALKLAASHRGQAVPLSPRQREVLCWTAQGLTADQIGDQLSISGHTVDMHLRMARQKLGVRSSVQAVAEAFRLGLIS